MNELTIRRAEKADVGAITAIYNRYVRDSTATFDTEEKSVSDRVAWLAEHDDRHPVLVVVVDGEIVGWGSVTPWGERPGWRHTVELSTYVALDATGRGIGPALLQALISECRAAGHHALIGQIVSDNAPSLKVAERAGFVRVGTLEQVGWKFGRWLDLALVELVLEG